MKCTFAFGLSLVMAAGWALPIPDPGILDTVVDDLDADEDPVPVMVAGIAGIEVLVDNVVKAYGLPLPRSLDKEIQDAMDHSDAEAEDQTDLSRRTIGSSIGRLVQLHSKVTYSSHENDHSLVTTLDTYLQDSCCDLETPQADIS
ncbi:hypothetical protein Q7P35_010135 [Cladosporium inversicolor]